MAIITVVNTRTTPYIVDQEGRLLEGSSRGQVDDSSDRVKRALASGIFVKVDPPAAAPPAEQPPAESPSAPAAAADPKES